MNLGVFFVVCSSCGSIQADLFFIVISCLTGVLMFLLYLFPLTFGKDLHSLGLPCSGVLERLVDAGFTLYQFRAWGLSVVVVWGEVGGIARRVVLFLCCGVSSIIAFPWMPSGRYMKLGTFL